MKRCRSFFSLLLCALICFSISGKALAAGTEPFGLTVAVDGTETVVRAYDNDYPGNLYLSLTDLSRALNGTAKQFRLTYSNSQTDGEVFSLTTGQPAADTKPVNAGQSRAAASLTLRRNRLIVDGKERRYYTYRADGGELYMSLVDVQLMLDLRAEYLSADRIALHPDEPFVPDVKTLAAEGYFDAFNGVLLGDANTGKILYYSFSIRAVPIASLSKLMTYLLVAEAVERGDISYDDTVTISQAASTLSRSADGMVFLAAGAAVPLSELLEAMLLASSNESALALAEHVAGSEASFVERMNARAKELGLLSARFYTPHGLPVYTESAVPAKLQNRMSASDMFKLTRILLDRFPEITEITSKLYGSMPTLGYTTANSNPLVFNMDGVTGLKTGSTNRAGYCLVASMPLAVGEETHTVVAIVLGAESADVRGQAAQLLLYYARDFFGE